MKEFINNFINEAKNFKVLRARSMQMIPHLKGEIAETESGEVFIRQTNAKYFGVDSDKLLGDFVEARFDDNNFIRLEGSCLRDIFVSEGWDGVEKFISDQIEYSDSIKSDVDSVINSITKYDEIKDKLIVRPLNYGYNKVTLEGASYMMTGDIALVLYVLVKDDAESGVLNTIKVPASIVSEWGIQKSDVFYYAMLNTNVYAMPRLYSNILNIENTDESEAAFMSPKYETKLSREIIPLVTTTKKTNGAIAMFYPGVKEKIAEMFGDSFYVAFTSIHEAMIHKAGTIDAESIRRHVKATNKTFGPADTLSDEVWFYNRANGEFNIVE